MKHFEFPLTREERSQLDFILNADGVVAIPTDTVFGLAARPDRAKAVDKIYRLKGRPRDKPLAMLFADFESLEDFLRLPRMHRSWGEAHWPGAHTLLVPAPETLAPWIRAGSPYLGVRIPDHPELQAVLKGLPPLAATSANFSGEPELSTPEEIEARFGSGLDAILTLAPLPRGKASRVVELDPHGQEIQRRG